MLQASEIDKVPLAYGDCGSSLAELAILEYFIHQSIVLRLNNLYPANPFESNQERLDNLLHAHYYSQIIQSMHT